MFYVKISRLHVLNKTRYYILLVKRMSSGRKMSYRVSCVTAVHVFVIVLQLFNNNELYDSHSEDISMRCLLLDKQQA